MIRTNIQSQSAHTLLELIMATSIVAATLVPSLDLLRSGMSLSQEIDRRNLMANYCVSKLEAHLAIVAATWTTGNVTGDFTTDGHPNVRFAVARSDAPSDGGIADRLMSVTVTVYDDADQNDAMDSSELRIVYRSKMARMATYEYEASS